MIGFITGMATHISIELNYTVFWLKAVDVCVSKKYGRKYARAVAGHIWFICGFLLENAFA